MSRYKLIILLLVIVIITSCAKENKITPIEIYTFETGTLSEENYSEFIEDNEPVLTESDIKIYDWSKHVIHLKKEYLDRNNDNNVEKKESNLLLKSGSNILKTDGGYGFIMVVDNEILYDGSFEQSITSSYYPVGVIIRDVDDGVLIDFNKADGSDIKDLRNSNKLFDALKGNNQLNDETQ